MKPEDQQGLRINKPFSAWETFKHLGIQVFLLIIYSFIHLFKISKLNYVSVERMQMLRKRNPPDKKLEQSTADSENRKRKERTNEQTKLATQKQCDFFGTLKTCY